MTHNNKEKTINETSFPNVRIIFARCNDLHHGFGIRVEEKELSNWCCDWTFPLTKQHARREKYHETIIQGNIFVDTQYPGCPHCGSKSIYKCGNCGKIACWNSEDLTVVCPWCNRKANMGDQTIVSLEVGQNY